MSEPLGDPGARRIESAIDQAIARGDFDDLPGAGKPLNLPARHDPDWWIAQRLADDDLDRDALLPAVVLLRREAESLDETLAELAEEDQVREALADFNTRVRDDRLRHPEARMLAPTVDVEERVERWRARRASTPRGSVPGPSVERHDPGVPRWLRMFSLAMLILSLAGVVTTYAVGNYCYLIGFPLGLLTLILGMIYRYAGGMILGAVQFGLPALALFVGVGIEAVSMSM